MFHLAAIASVQRSIDEPELASLEVRQVTDIINQLSRGFWCHLGCLNSRLHPAHLVQNWTFDPAEIERQAEELLKGPKD